MTRVDSKSYGLFEDLIARSGGTYAFNDETAVEGFGLIFEIIRDMGLDPFKTEDL